MFFSYLFLLASIAGATSWFSSEPNYAKWSHAELRTWLEQHNVKVPPSFDKSHLYDLVDANWKSLSSARQWTVDQYSQAQRAFQHIKDDTFDQWDESKLRAFLLEHGVAAPSGSRDQLVLLAKYKYRAYTDAAALYSSLASGSISSAYAGATEAASSATHCISSTVAQATTEVGRAFDDTRDYFYSAWDDNQLRKWLEEHGVIEAKTVRTEDELTRLIYDYFQRTASPVWESWSDSYIREWLVAHNLLKPSDTRSRPSLLTEMKKYYYKCTDNVWNTWPDSELKSWLVNHRLLSSDAQKKRDELIRMVGEDYPSTADIIWGAWTDSDIRQWLLENGYLESRDEVKDRNDLVSLINRRYGAITKATSYLVWPDARLRAYLRERGISESALPTDRPGLLQETRIHWVQVSTRTETILAKLKEIINNSVEAVEDKVARIFEVLSGHSRDIAHHLSGKADDAKECANMKKAHAWSWGSHKVDEAKEKADEMRDEAGKYASQKARGDEL